MKSEITISELAKLMNVSVHQIRYFEEKGVLQPSYTDNNQYRMYDMEQVYQLAQILLLRKLEVPVSSIKECMTSYSGAQYRQLLHSSLRDIEVEMQRLRELQQFIQKVLHEQQDVMNSTSTYQIKRREPRYFTRWIEMYPQTKLTAKQLVEQQKSIPNLFEMDIHYIDDGSRLSTLCLETQAPGDFSVPEGDYLAMQCAIQEVDELDQVVEQFYEYAATQSYVVWGPLIVIEKSYLSLFSNNQLHYELQTLIKPVVKSEGGYEHDCSADND
ncbi:MerR family transcriptional regulator [Paenibacillus sp. NAIST15-1]|uniref:MerR family transcriptional regulator n=1 Tax=Paenibacillus sp. NAIST15-1 TaxID=1605994 RepID=UPI00086D2CAE|nr:MerR family transcriptional regulator [Paenibacillus sp. NAIST15-1]GAV12967.1 putative transcriptional regulator [Paenibacillus sp. NAIST15-1]